MSQISNKLAKVIKSNFHRGGHNCRRRHEPSESVSSRPSRGVGDSARTIEGRRITNIATGTFTGFTAGAQRVLPAPSLPTSLDARRGPRRSRHPLICLTSLALLASTLIILTSTNNIHAYTASITTSGSSSINVKPGADGGTGTSIGSDVINVATTCRAGYNLTMSASVSDNNLYLNGSSSNNTSGQYFVPSDGTTALSSAPNTWGYYFNSADPTTPTKDSTFSAVPASTSTAATIKSPVTSATDINDSFNVYYGVAVSNSIPLGTYKMVPATSGGSDYGSITYYLTMAESCTSYLISFNPTSTVGGNILTGTGTMDDQAVHEGETVNLSANKFVAPDGYVWWIL